MTLPISPKWGLTILAELVRIAAYLLISWTYAEKNGLGDEFVDGLRWLVRHPFEAIQGRTPGGVA